MNCDAAREALGADPSSREAGLITHLAQCAACTAEAARLQAMNAALRCAMSVPVPEVALPGAPRLVATDPRSAATRAVARRPLALAAGVGGLGLLAGLLWLTIPRESLASAVVAHMAHEPGAWATRDVLADEGRRRELDGSGVELPAASISVTYAERCWFRGRFVPHVVVQQPDGPVTLMVLRHVAVGGRTPFDERGYRGVIVPTGQGSIAVLARDESSVDIDAAATAAVAAVRYVE